MAEELSPALDAPEVLQMYGMLHLSAALAAAAQVDRDTATTHLHEATAVADRMDTEVGTFARLWFGTTNVGIWRTSLATEFGDGPKVAEIASTVNVATIPSPSRRASLGVPSTTWLTSLPTIETTRSPTPTWKPAWLLVTATTRRAHALRRRRRRSAHPCDAA